MTSTQVQKKIDELSLAKEELIRKSSLIDPSNTALFYSTKNMEETAGTEGVTPRAIAITMDKIGSVILEYVDMMRNAPHIKSSPILSKRKKVSVAVEEGATYPTATLQKRGENLSIQEILPIMHEAEVKSAVMGLKFYSNVTIQSEDRRTDIQYEVILYKINSFSNDITTFRSGMGNLSVEISKDHINIDDIFIMGVVFKEHINPNIPYYVDTSFLIKKTTDIEEEYRGTISGLNIGIQNLDIDSSLTNGMLLFSIFGFSGLIAIVNSTVDTAVSLTIGEDTYSPMGRYDNNTISEIGTRGKMIAVRDKNISLWEGVGDAVSIHQGYYDLYETEERSSERVIFNNLRPIDLTVEEAIRDI